MQANATKGQVGLWGSIFRLFSKAADHASGVSKAFSYMISRIQSVRPGAKHPIHHPGASVPSPSLSLLPFPPPPLAPLHPDAR